MKSNLRLPLSPRVKTIYRNKLYLGLWPLGFYSWEELHPETEQSEKVDFRKPWYLTYKREGIQNFTSDVKGAKLQPTCEMQIDWRVGEAQFH